MVRLNIQAARRVLQQDQRERGPEKRKQGTLLVAAGKRFNRASRRTADIERFDSLLRKPGALIAIDEHAFSFLGEHKVFRQCQAGDQPLLHSGGGHEGHTAALEGMIRLAGQILPSHQDPPAHRT